MSHGDPKSGKKGQQLFVLSLTTEFQFILFYNKNINAKYITRLLSRFFNTSEM